MRLLGGLQNRRLEPGAFTRRHGILNAARLGTGLLMKNKSSIGSLNLLRWAVCELSAAILFLPVLAGEAGAGASPYAKWPNGPPADAGFFPIAVWLQAPAN